MLAWLRRRPRIAMGLLLLFALGLVAAGTDVMSLKGCDEALYAQIAREMAASGDWWTLHYHGLPHFEKPPLLIWLIAAVFQVAGVGAWQARLPVFALAIVAVGLAAFLVWRNRQDAGAAVLAGGIVATTALFVQLEHQVMMDVPVLAFLTLAWVGLLGMERDARWGWAVGPSLGLIVLTKGALGALFVLAHLPYLVFKRPRWSLGLGFGLVLGLLPAACWYASMHHLWGRDFWHVHLGMQVLARAQGKLFAADPLGPAYYLVHGLGFLLPVSLWVPMAVGGAWRRARVGDRASWLALSFSAVFLACLSLMHNKFDHYALPLLLPLAVMTADRAVETPRARRRGLAIALGLVALVLGAGVVAVNLPVISLFVSSRAGAMATLALLAATYGGAAVACWRPGLDPQRLAILVAGTAAAVGVGALTLHPWDAWPGLRELAARIPAGTPAKLVGGPSPVEDVCPCLAARFAAPGPLDWIARRDYPAAPSGWYLGELDELRPASGDRVVLEARGWRLVERPASGSVWRP